MFNYIKKSYKKVIALSLLPCAVYANYLPVQIVNNTKIADDNAVYVTIKGTDHATQKPCLIHFNQDGRGSCDIVTSQTKFSDYVYALGALPSSGADRLVYLPKVDSGRVYFSIGSPVEMYIDASNPGAITIIDPDGFKPRDVNYYTLYDKIEFSYNDNGVWINPTAVDFFSLPIKLQLPGSTSGFSQAGLGQSRAGILNQVQTIVNTNDKTPNKMWNNLFVNYKDDQQGQALLRVMAPGKAMVTNVADTTPFDSQYLAHPEVYGFSYIDFVWNYYQTNTLTIDCSELAGNPAAPKLDNYLFTGRVINNVFTFTNQTGSYTVPMNKPTTSRPFFAGAELLDPSLEANNHPGAIIVREMTAAFDAGLLPTSNGAVLNRNYFIKNKAAYFQMNPLLPQTALKGPWYDLYSKAFHSFGDEQPIYTFAYDDALSQDGTLHDPNGNNPSTLTVTLADMSGTIIPSPWQDSATYSITVQIGAKSSVKYIVDPKDRSKDVPLTGGQILPNVSMPFEVEMNGQVMDIYIKHPMVKPFSRNTDGIVINHVAGSNEATVIFPGR